MSRFLRIILIWVLCMLSACSFGTDQAQVESTPEPAAPAVAVQTERTLPGRILYVREGQIWLHQGTDARPLQIDGTVRDPAWSADGRRIAFIRREESYSDLYVLDTESGRTTQITENDSTAAPRSQEYVHRVIWAAKPTWSPDGQELVFLSQVQPATGPDDDPPIYEHPLALYRYKTALIGTRQPTNDDLLSVHQDGSDLVSPTWSPDGRYLAYVQAPREGGMRRIMLYDFETEEARQYPGTPEGAYDPAWSPDGNRLAFAAAQDGSTDIWTTGGPQENSTPQRLTSVGRARSPVWSPDGTSIAFLQVGDTSTDLYVVDLQQQNGRLEGGEPVAITEGAQIDATAGLSWSK